jgi:putative mRNA 3-end processing factor
MVPTAPVSWRDGVHLTGTPIWCDARRRRDVCFLSSADRAGRSGHSQLIATAATLALIGARDKGHLAVPLRQRFTLGTVRTTAGGAGEAGEVRSCDAVVVAAPYGAPDHRFPPLAGAIEATIEWARAQLAEGRGPVLLVDALLDGLEVASRLAADGIAIAGARALRDAAQRIADLVPAIAAPGREPRTIVWLDADREGLVRSLGDRPFATALVSARAAGGFAGSDAGFAWATAADRPQLLGWIESTGAREVFVTGACAESIVAALGPRARVIGPPHQMSLFPGEAVS